MSASARIQDDRLVLATQLHSLLLNEIGALIAQSQICERTIAEGGGSTLCEVARLREMLKNLEDTTRNLIDAAILPHGASLAEVLRQEINEFQCRNPGVAVSSSVDSVTTLQIGWLTRLVVDVVRESLTNAAKHGNPSRIEIVATLAAAGLLIRIRDDGRGFDARRLSVSEAARVPGRYGLRIMHETVASTDGRLEVSSAPGKGTQITLFVPLTGGRVKGSNGDLRVGKDLRGGG